MQQRKHRVGFAFFPYGGNGGTSSEVPDIRNWLVRTVMHAKSDPRVEEVLYEDFCDTPITMTRNRAVQWARDHAIDALIMVDSDMSPDLYAGATDAKPFFQSSFDFYCSQYERGPVVVGAPYCGPPSHPRGGGGENVYVFRWANWNSGNPNTDFRLDQYGREESQSLAGIQECAALPTGLILFDIRVFDLIPHPYFYYEWTDGTESAKSSTEDVTCTRDLSLNGVQKLGYNPIFCNWDAWAGHWKPLCVGKPLTICASDVSHKLASAVLSGRQWGEQVRRVRPSARLAATRAGNPVATNPTPLEGLTDYREGPAALSPYEAGKRRIALGDNEFGHRTPELDLDCLRALVAHEASSVKLEPRPFRIVELGSWVGTSAIYMAQGVEPGQEYAVHCVDHWRGTGTDLMREAALLHGSESVLNQFLDNVEKAGISKYVTMHRGDSTKTGLKWHDGPVDFLFIDAGHTFHEVCMDIDAWFRNIRPLGLICGHDFCDVFPGVMQAVEECFGKLYELGGQSIWHTRKTAELAKLYEERLEDRKRRQQAALLASNPKRNGEAVHAES